MRKIILTGDRPTGRLRVGYYMGSLKRRVGLRNSEELDKIYIMMAGAQVLIDDADSPEEVRRNIIGVALDYLTCGLGLSKSVLFIRSQIPELCEVTFYYMDLVTVSRLRRNPTIESKVQMRNFGTSIPMGFFTYPIGQAANITAFKAATVPAGEGQAPMIEQTRKIVHKFNTVYGGNLVELDILLPDNKACLYLPGTDGKAKMSKSLGNYAYLTDSEADMKKKIISMFTDLNHLRVEDPGQVEGNPVFVCLDAFYRNEYFTEYLPDYRNLDELKAHYVRGGFGDVKVKKFLNNVFQDELRPIRERRKEFAKDIPAMYRILEEGSRKAQAKAVGTLAKMRRAIKTNYFEDEDLIAKQALGF